MWPTLITDCPEVDAVCIFQLGHFNFVYTNNNFEINGLLYN